MAYRRAKISTTAIGQLKPGQTLMDTLEPGFGVRRQRGAPVFFVRKFANGRRHFETIGEYGTGGLTVTAARNKASGIIAAIRDGMSPTERRARERAMPTLAELADQWLRLHVDPKLKPKTATCYRSTLTAHLLPALGRLRVDQIDQPVIVRMHHAARDTPYAANRALGVLSKLMVFAEQQGYRPKGTNPVKGLVRYREDKRERFLSSQELAALGHALSAPAATERHSSFALKAIAFLLLTGMRLQEVLRLKWSDVDFERGLLLLGDSKSGAKPVILGRRAVELLGSLPRADSSRWVFPSSVSSEKPMSDLKKAWRTVRSLAGLDGVRLHDLRHSYASVAVSSGGSLPMIGRLLGHTQPATTSRYAHLAVDPVRDLADQTSAVIAGALQKATPSA